MNHICPICSSILLRHLHQHEIAWVCPKCRQEMPNLALGRAGNIRRRILQLRSYQARPELTNIQQTPNNHVKQVAEASLTVNLLIDEGKKRLEIVSLILNQINWKIFDSLSQNDDEAASSQNYQSKVLVSDCLRGSEVILLYICQAILAGDISLLNRELCQKLKANYVRQNLPIELLICWLSGIKISVMDLIGTMAVDLSDSLLDRNRTYLASEIASYFDVVIASLI